MSCSHRKQYFSTGRWRPHNGSLRLETIFTFTFALDNLGVFPVAGPDGTLGRNNKMIRVTILAAALLVSASAAFADEPIVGNWKTVEGDTAAITPCADSYCVTLKTGKYAGRQIGKMQGKDGSYTGELTDPSEDKTYSGSGSVSGNTVRMKGCVLKIFCKSQTWTRL